MTRSALSLNLDDARSIIAAGELKATEMGTPHNIAVTDAGGGLIAHVRMDGARLGSVDIAINKAWTAQAFDLSTDDCRGRRDIHKARFFNALGVVEAEPVRHTCAAVMS